MSDTKLNRPDGLTGTTTSNAQQQQAQSQQQQQQQQQTINYIPNYHPYFLQSLFLFSFLFFSIILMHFSVSLDCYPNMLTIVPNTPQANTTNPQFSNKPYNFNNTANIGN